MANVFKSAIAVILVGLLAYSAVGAFVNSYYIVLNDDLPTEGKPKYLGVQTFAVTNNAPWVLPYVSPTYSLSIRLLSNASNVRCEFLGLLGDEGNCQTVARALGNIPSGGTEYVSVRMGGDGDFTFEVVVTMSLFIPIPAKSQQISCRVLPKDLGELNALYVCSPT